MKAAEPSSIRLVPELRAVHVERYYETTPALMLYFTRNYDLHGFDVPAEIRQVTLGQALRIFWMSKATILEMPEPLWVRFLPKGVAIAAGFKLTGLLRGHRRLVATYAMENNSLACLIGGRHRVPVVIVRLFALSLGIYMRLFIDRIGFASRGSEMLYRSLPFVKAIPFRVIEELPSALPSAETSVKREGAIFVGILEARKGVVELLEAWRLVERERPDAVLTIVGPGSLEPLVTKWASESPGSRQYLGQLQRTSILELLLDNRVLVAPSLPSGRWREQIGLPIKEALSRGLTVVTSRQTGLADWLAAHGHHVVEIRNGVLPVAALASATAQALAHPLDRRVVREELPTVQGRYASDAWLHENSQ